MPELSNSVRQRLGALPVPPIHPDANTLTAYIERLLPSGERNQVVEHLAACSFCRDIVALSVPELPEKTMVQSLPAPSRFWTFGFRWAGALAVIAITVALVVEWSGHKQAGQAPATAITPSISSASTEHAGEPAQTKSVPVPATSEPSQTRSASGLAAVASRLNREAAPPPAPALTADLDGAQSQGDDKANLQFSYSGAANGILEPSNSLPKPASVQKNAFVNSGLVNNGLYSPGEHSTYSEARKEQAKAEAERAKKDSSLALAAAPEDSGKDTKGFLRKAFPLGPITSSVLSTLKSAAAGASSSADTRTSDRSGFATTAAAPVRPPISPGSVARTATTITHGPTEARKAKTASSDQLHWRVQDGKLVNSADLNQWHEAYPQSDEIQFKVVQAQGHEVWAGGTNGTLVHSWDGGVDWQKLNLGDAASGDIEKISLSGGDVQVKTSNGQHLISRDGGKTWAPLNPQDSAAPPNQPK